MKSIFLLTALLAAAGPAPAACKLPKDTVNVALPSGLPPALRNAMGDVAMPGEPFDTTDVYIKGHRHSRYIFVWNLGKRWIVATEQGGIALFVVVFVYEIGKNDKAVLIERRNTSEGGVCATATRLAGR